MDAQQHSTEDFASIAPEPRVAAVISALKAHDFAAEAVDDAVSARNRVLALVAPGAKVFTGSSRTLEESGIAAELNNSGRFDAIRPQLAKLDRRTQRREMRMLASTSDFAVGSCHAITQEGVIMTASATGSQLSHYVYSAEKVILVVGAQKLVADELQGMRRIEEYCVPLENDRALQAMGIPTVLSRVLTLRRDLPAGRTTVILVRRQLGF
jgi:YkgG family uncharacterized protein